MASALRKERSIRKANSTVFRCSRLDSSGQRVRAVLRWWTTVEVLQGFFKSGLDDPTSSGRILPGSSWVSILPPGGLPRDATFVTRIRTEVLRDAHLGCRSPRLVLPLLRLIPRSRGAQASRQTLTVTEQVSPARTLVAPTSQAS